MQLGYVGLGKMGQNMVKRLLEKGHDVVAYDQDNAAVVEAENDGAVGVNSLEELVDECDEPRFVWIMVPHQFVGDVLDQLTLLLAEGDTVIDGGNSHFRKSLQRDKRLDDHGVTFMDVGVSGGPEGARHGACMMVGGPKKRYEQLEPLFADLTVDDGYGYIGRAGAGHFVKMVHNGIEYGMMQAIAEGFSVMKDSEFALDLSEVARVYNHGSVIESSLVEWTRNAFDEFGEDLERISGEVSHSGEGKWTVEAAEDMDTEVPVISEAFAYRLQTHDSPTFTGKIVSALRNQFGGHDVFTDTAEEE